MNYHSIIRRDPNARLELVEAYTRLFSGVGNKQDAETVFTDIMSFSGYFNICSEHVSLERHEGCRMVGGRIWSMVNLPDTERDALYAAARKDSMINQLEGDI
jgi:hypothetical protein